MQYRVALYSDIANPNKLMVNRVRVQVEHKVKCIPVSIKGGRSPIFLC